MRQILCFGDSNTWGLDGDSGKRLPWGVRWTSLLQEKLGQQYHVIEEGLCGRTTIFDDPLRDGRRGTELLPILLETHATVDGVVLMLGTNDCKTAFGASAEVIGKGIERLLRQIRYAAPQAEILLISPIYLGDNVWRPECDPEFSQASIVVSQRLQSVYETIAKKWHVGFLRAADYAVCSAKDQEHYECGRSCRFCRSSFTRSPAVVCRETSGWRSVKKENCRSSPLRMLIVQAKKYPADTAIFARGLKPDPPENNTVRGRCPVKWHACASNT